MVDTQRPLSLMEKALLRRQTAVLIDIKYEPGQNADPSKCWHAIAVHAGTQYGANGSTPAEALQKLHAFALGMQRPGEAAQIAEALATFHSASNDLK